MIAIRLLKSKRFNSPKTGLMLTAISTCKPSNRSTWVQVPSASKSAAKALINSKLASHPIWLRTTQSNALSVSRSQCTVKMTCKIPYSSIALWLARKIDTEISRKVRSSRRTPDQLLSCYNWEMTILLFKIFSTTTISIGSTLEKLTQAFSNRNQNYCCCRVCWSRKI